MLKTLGVLAAAGLLGLIARGITLEQDPVKSLADPDPVRAELFERYQKKNPLKGRLFVEAPGLEAAQRHLLDGELARAGYREIPLWAPPSPAELASLAPILPAERVAALLSDEAMRARASGVVELASLPGTAAVLETAQADPLGLGQEVAAQLGFSPRGGQAGAPVRIFERNQPLDYSKIGVLYERLAAMGDEVRFIGGDFFSYENYLAVQHDIVVISALSVALNLVIFYGFTGRWALLGLLFLGSAISYLTGLLGTWLVYADIQAVVLAYTSTFVGFNNESLVHLAGVDARRRRTTILGIGSAIGTTFIGFLVLLAGRSEIVRQMALASLGGMVGFLLFLIPYRTTIQETRFRSFEWRKLALSPRALAMLCASAAVATAAVGIPLVETKIDGFRYQTPILASAVEHFSKRLEEVSLEDVVAVPVAGDPLEAIARLEKEGLLDLAHHPLKVWRGLEQQRETLKVLDARAARAQETFGDALNDAGLSLGGNAAAFKEVDAWSFLEKLGSIGPVIWAEQVGDQRFVLASLRKDARLEHNPELAPVSPRRYYDTLLTGLSRELGWLFALGLAAMALYLAYLQHDALKVLYVFAPLSLAALAFASYARFAHVSLNIIHVMGFSLVIALAMDYTAVAVSSGHAPEELSKVLLTGLSTLATFGVLGFARHPVLRDLGATVAIGCGVSLLFALFLRLEPRKAGGP